MSGYDVQNTQAFTLLTEQLSRTTTELVAQRDSHMALVKELSQQNATLAALAERITAQSRVLEERKNTDHMRISILESRMSANEVSLDDLRRFKWKVMGSAAAIAVIAGNAGYIALWIT